eukprot:GFUD01040322.1.p1 GENE.GFUD01040322.1~~GFUD01040322.1.p1  ORF type:complete len:733 (-),score=287.32 GFUD01040322.1:364-2508(-)
MSMSQLATSGDELKIWDTHSFLPLHQYTSPTHPGSSISSSLTSNCWSSDTSCVASIVKGRDRVVLSYSKNNKYTSQELTTQGITGPTVLQFPKTTQKHLMISAGPDLHVYDIAKSKVRKSFSLKSNITSFTVNHCDAYIAVGCSDGSLNLATLATNQVSSPMVAPRCAGQKVTSVQYSSVKPSFLGSSCESGVLSFWDCNASKNIFNLTPHCAPATAITFSPINDTLALSVGLDKRLVCCDTKTKKVIMSIQCENPLTAADFDLDGVSMAVGTSRGKVLVYDLRSPKTPIRSLTAHNTSVTSLVYKHRVDKQQVSQVMSAVKAKPKLAQHKSTPSLRTVQEESKENTEPVTEVDRPRAQIGSQVTEELEQDWIGQPDDIVFMRDDSLVSTNRRDSLSSQLFSPLREADISFPSSQAGYSITKEGRRVSEVRLSSDGLFSPLREANSPSSSVSSLQMSFKKTPYTSFTTPTMSPLTSIREETTRSPSSPAKPLNISREHFKRPEKLSLEKLDDFVKKASAGEKSPMFDREEVDNVDGVREALKFNLGEKKILVNECPEEEKLPSIVKPCMSSTKQQPEDFLSVLTAFPDLGLETVGQHHQPPAGHVHLAATRIADRLTTSPDSGVATFQRDYISGVVSEAMEEWCSGVERRLWGLQYSLLRQLQQHQDETKVLLAESAGMGEMREELTRLRRENEELRKFFGNDPADTSYNYRDH